MTLPPMASTTLAARQPKARLQAAGLHAASQPEPRLGPGRIVALHHHSSTLYQIREHIRCLYF
jgi:hypothetical protein